MNNDILHWFQGHYSKCLILAFFNQVRRHETNLFTKYVFSGIILYGMVIGKLPFSTHYTDQYRRQKLLVQIQKGIAENHVKELTLHGISPGREQNTNRKRTHGLT